MLASKRPSLDELARLPSDEGLTELEKWQLNGHRLSILPWSGELHHKPGLKMLAFQPDACRYALARNRSYLWLDPGLGKTIIAAVTAQTLFNLTGDSIVYVCPPFLVNTVRAEFEKWTHLKVRVYRSKKPDLDCDVLILPDSLIARGEVPDNLRKFLVASMRPRIFIDEAHRFKTPDSQRTVALVARVLPLFWWQCWMSGTAAPNMRSMELWPVLRHAAHDLIDRLTYFNYGLKYCGAKKIDGHWDFSGRSNQKELARRTRGPDKFFLRMKKTEVLKDLPPKTRQMVLVNKTMSPTLAALDKKLLREHSPEDLMRHRIGGDHHATYRRLLGIEKIDPALTFIKGLLESGEPVLIFCIHKEVVAGLREGLKAWNPLVIDGDVAPVKRKSIQDEFQAGTGAQPLIANIQAGGIGLTLTRARMTVHVEFSYVPGENTQAEDRIHRIGQHENTLHYYLVYENSGDRKVMEAVLEKQASIDEFERNDT